MNLSKLKPRRRLTSYNPPPCSDSNEEYSVVAKPTLLSLITPETDFIRVEGGGRGRAGAGEEKEGMC